MKNPLLASLLLAVFFLILWQPAAALQFGNETSVPAIASGSFKMMNEPELDSLMFIQFQLVDENSTPLEYYHTELKIYDNRGVKTYPLPIESPAADFAYSDSNGFVNYLIFLPSCNLFKTDYCFQLDANYTAIITGKNIYREELFVTQLKTIRTNYIGDSLRFINVNIGSFFLILLAFAMLVSISIAIYAVVKKK